jgi:hypothetical protein
MLLENDECHIQQLTLSMTGKAVHVQAMQAYRGIRGIAPLIANLGTIWM